MIKIIVAYDKNRVIGAENKLLWRSPEDMKHFKDQTTGHNCIMGSNTWFSIPEKYRPLADRYNIVVTSKNLIPEETNKIAVSKSVGSAIMIARFSAEWGKKDIFITGGESIYQAGLEFAEEIIATEFDFEADTTGLSNIRYFPLIDMNVWEEAAREDHSEANPPFAFVTYKRRGS
ncbi:MAG TPA: dihydrofolate reductase [Candidatus Doudnabacteria bacterium]|nr:dihydrofolate reductase [Candidatus Doudnabacteria bacterium]